MALNIIPDLLPSTHPNVGGPMEPKYLTLHDTANPARGADAAAHGRYLRSQEAVDRQVSWHFTCDDREIRQHLPVSRNGWHASDGNGPGNTQSIGIEICENEGINRVTAESIAALLCAHLIKTVPSLLPFPECMKQHHDFARDKKNCPRIIRGRPQGWEGFLKMVSDRLGPPPWNPADEIDRLMQRKYINTRHNPNAMPNWGELATVLNRILDRVEGKS